MGNFLNSLFGSSQSSSYQPPAILQNTITDLLTRAGTQSQQPYPQYTPDTAAQYSQYNPGLVAPLTPNQVQAGQSIAGLQGYTQPNFNAATGLSLGSVNPLQMQQFSQGAVNQYLNPYLNDVVGSAVANINQTNAQQQQEVLGNAIQRGAFGGDRAGIAQAELARQQGLANNATIANLLGQGYSQAQQQFNQQQQTDLATQLQNRQLLAQGANQLANLGTQGQQAALQQAQAQYGFGTTEQQQQQAGLSNAYQQYLNQQMYPYQQLGWYAQLASGTAPSLGGTTTQYSPTYSPYNMLQGLGTLGVLGNSGQASSNPFATALSGLGNLASGASSAAASMFPFYKDGGRANYDSGGRTGYADGGNPVSPVTQAYDDYINAANSGAPYDVLQQLYQKYQQSFQGATPPFKNAATTPVATTAPTATTPPAPGVAAVATGDHGGANQGLITARNAAYSPDYTSSNGPVGGGGYGPYDAGGGPGTAFNPGGPLGGLISGIAAALQGTTNVNKTPYDPNYTGVVSSMGPEMAKTGYVAYDPTSDQIVNNYGGYSGIPSSTSALDQSTGPSADLPARKDYNTDASSGLLAAIAAQESGGSKNPNTAVGDGGAALGQFQMHNPAARQAATELGLNYDPSMRADPNIAPALAQQYLSDMFNYTGTIPGAIAAYNMGPGAYKAAVQAGQDPTQGAYTQGVLGTGLVDVNRGIMPPGPAPLPPERPASMDVQQSSPENLPSQAPGAVEAGRGDNLQSRDTSGDRANIYSAPIGPGLISQGETLNAASRDTEGGEGGGGEKRGGRIHKAAAGSVGYTPFHMQYGLPTEQDIKTEAQDFAGSGAGVLGPQLQALAAKGVLGSNVGGRIHKQDAGSVTGGAEPTFQYGDERDAFGPISDEARSASSVGETIEKAPIIGPVIQANRQAIERAMGTDPQSVAAQQEAANRPYHKAAGTYTASYEPKVEQMGTEAFKLGDASQVGKTQPIIPKNAPAAVSQADMPAPKAVNAQATHYVAPPPEDRNRMAALAYFAAGASPGANLGDSARAYAQSMMATQGQERATMTTQAQAEQAYAAAEASRASAMASRIKPTPDGLSEVYTGDDGKIYYRDVTNDTTSQLPALPGLPGVGGAGLNVTPDDATLGPQYDDGTPTSIAKRQTMQAMGAKYKKMGLGTNAPKMQEDFQKMLNGAQDENTVAQNTSTDLAMAIQASASSQADPYLTPGAAIQYRKVIANYLNTLNNIVYGNDPAHALNATAENLTADQIRNKISTLTTQAQQRGLGREAGFWLQTLKEAYPNDQMTTQASNDLLANMIVSNGRSKDRANVYNQYAGDSSRMGVDAPQVFGAVNPASHYAKDTATIADILNHPTMGTDGKMTNMISALQNGQLKGGAPAFDAYVKAHYGVSNLSRYFQ